MNQISMCPIVFSEWFPTGVMVHFEGGLSVFFPASFLYEQREIQPNQMFQTGQSTQR
jgi:ribosomal protein S1